MKSLSVVIPAYNEEKIIAQTVESVFKYLVKNVDDFEIIVVDDGSNDNTFKILNKLRGMYLLTVVTYKANRGKGAAVRSGVLASTKEWVLVMDADNSTGISELDNFERYLDRDIVVGSRALDRSKIRQRQPFFREFGGILLNKFIQLKLGLNIHDTQCGFKLFRGDLAREISQQSKINGFAFDVEVLVLAKKLGAKIVEVPVEWSNRVESHVKFRHVLEFVKDVLRI